MSYSSEERQVVTTLVTDQTFYRVARSVISLKKILQTKCLRERYEHFKDLHFGRRIANPIPINVDKVYFGLGHQKSLLCGLVIFPVLIVSWINTAVLGFLHHCFDNGHKTSPERSYLFKI